MKHCRKYADFSHLFENAEYVADRVAAILNRAVETESGCLVLPSFSNGYARASFGNVTWQAHRLLWLIEHGDIGGLVIDHKCRNRGCVNTAHLEPVTNAENIRRGKIVAHGGKCPKGHELRAGARQMYCQTCKDDWFRKRYRSDPAFAERMREKRRQQRARARATEAA